MAVQSRNKRLVKTDLRRLIATCNAVIENFRPGTLERVARDRAHAADIGGRASTRVVGAAIVAAIGAATPG